MKLLYNENVERGGWVMAVCPGYYCSSSRYAAVGVIGIARVTNQTGLF